MRREVEGGGGGGQERGTWRAMLGTSEPATNQTSSLECRRRTAFERVQPRLQRVRRDLIISYTAEQPNNREQQSISAAEQ